MTRSRSRRGKRERSTSAAPPPLSKRLRGPSVADDPPPTTSAAAPAQVVVTGLPSDCSVLELKSRLEQFGAISRIKIHGSGSGDVTFRSEAAAQAAVSASLEPGLGISVGSCKVLVVRPSEPPVEETTEIALHPFSKQSVFSRLLRPEAPLKKHGRSNKKLTTELISSSRSEPDLGSVIPIPRTSNDPYLPTEGREVVAYDDLF